MKDISQLPIPILFTDQTNHQQHMVSALTSFIVNFPEDQLDQNS